MLEVARGGIVPKIATTSCRRFGHSATDRITQTRLDRFFRIMDGTI
ncbi:MAG: hypothetical protein MI861_08780 [Pirellulales bacterium]|nr:hypothetical protein [Pirellulales bacterium]